MIRPMDEGKLVEPSGTYENQWTTFLGTKVSNENDQEIEYHFLIKDVPSEELYFFEHIIESETGVFYPKDWMLPSFSSKLWIKDQVLKLRTLHKLPKGKYEFFVGFASFTNHKKRLEFPATLDNRIPLGTVELGGKSNRTVLKSESDSITILKSEYEELVRIRNRLGLFRGTAFPIYVSELCKVIARPERGNISHKAAVISVPKAGTYLAAELVTNLKIIPAKLHVSMPHVEDFRFYSHPDLSKRNEVFHPIPLEIISDIIQPGQFIAGHIPFNQESEIILRPFKKIFAFRNLRDTIVTTFRGDITDKQDTPEMKEIMSIEAQPQRLLKYLELYGDNIFKDIKQIAKWFENDVFRLRFETLVGDYGIEEQHQCVFDLCKFLGIDPSTIPIKETLLATIGKQTLTFSGSRSKVEEYWDSKVEESFVKLGGNKINELFGYQRI